jgi:hypothetical protein
MQMSTSPTPRDERNTYPSFGFENLLEAQTRLWNHLLDANRSLWSFYTPWLPTGAWVADRAAADNDKADAGTEPAATVDGIPDPFELQARSWNRFLDAQRSFWTALSWPVPATPWLDAADEAKADATGITERSAPAQRSSRRKA